MGAVISVPLSTFHVVLALTLCAVLVYYRFLRLKTLYPTVPGPKPLPFLANVPLVLRNKERINHMLLELTKEHGRSFTFCLPFSPPYLATSEPAVIEHILKTKFSNYIKGPEFIERFREILGNGIFNADGNLWKNQRQIASHLFTKNTLSQFMTDTIMEHARILTGRLSEIGPNKKVDMQDMFFRFTMDSIAKIAFGKTLGCLTSEKVEFADAFDRAQFLAEKRFYSPIWKLERWWGTAAEKELASCVKVLDEFAYGIVNERKQESSEELRERADLLSMFMSSTDHDGRPFTDAFLRDVIMNFIIAGRDTTANTLSWLFYEVARHPEVEAKLVEEIEQELRGGEPDYDTVERRMKYLEAVVYETLRLHTPVPKDPKQAVEDDVLPNGMKVPAGTLVTYMPWVMGRLDEIWPRAEEFLPERWINNPLPSPFKYPVFQAGPRICLGRNMALLEAKLCTVYLLQHFSFRLVKPDMVAVPKISATLPMADPLEMYVRRR